MKRKNKCVGKRAYAFRSNALKVAKKMYLQGNKKIALYECPNCLDFHLTTKWCNLQSKMSVWKQESMVKKNKKARYEAFDLQRKIFQLIAKIDYSKWLWITQKLRL